MHPSMTLALWSSTSTLIGSFLLSPASIYHVYHFFLIGLLLSLIIGTLLGDILSFILGSHGSRLGVGDPLILERSPRSVGDGDLSEYEC